LEYLGIGIDEEANRRHAARISSAAATVRVIRTNEESVIAASSIRLLQLTTN
jgi:acetate kinase